MTHPAESRASALRDGAVSFVLAGAYLVVLSAVFDPIWETNDDVAMAMVAHGYGFAAFGSPNLWFSSVIWGHVVRALDGVLGLQGYSVGTLAVLLLAGWSYLYFLRRLSIAYAVALPLVAAVLTWPMLFPQFTTNAGLMAVAAVLGLHVYSRTNERSALVASAMLAVIGYLVRSLEVVLVGAVAMPFLSWRALFRDRAVRLVGIAVLVAITGVQIADRVAYRSSEWQAFDARNQARAPYTDFGIGNRLKERPDILAAHGFSRNDVDLIARWFFEDPALVDPGALNAMSRAIGPGVGKVSLPSSDPRAGVRGLSQILSPRVRAQTLCALLLLMLVAPRRRVAVAWTLVILAVFGLGFVGAQVHGRVLFPIVALLLLMTVALPPPTRDPYSRMGLSLLMIATFAGALVLLPMASETKERIRAAQGPADGRTDPIFVWGAALDFAAAYPVRSAPADRRSYPPLYALGALTYAPFSVAVQQGRLGRSLLERLRSPAGIDILALDRDLSLLRIYCRDHLGSELQLRPIPGGKIPGLRNVSCIRSPAKG